MASLASLVLGIVFDGRYSTQAKKSWLLGKVLGLVHEGNGLDAICGIGKVFEEHFISWFLLLFG